VTRARRTPLDPDLYAAVVDEAKGLPKRKIITREDAEAARSEFKVGDYVSFDFKREQWRGKIVSRGAAHATVKAGDKSFRIPYPSLQKVGPPLHAEKVAGVDKPAAGESLTAWQARTGRSR
jgi:sporulation protein YlmC with PRC-barrel domain